MQIKTTLLLACIAIAPSLLPASSILDFETAPNGPADQTYGDRLSGTPNILVSYSNVVFEPQQFAIIGSTRLATPIGARNSIAQITFTLDAGFGVTLTSFDLGAYANAPQTVNRIKLKDNSNNLLLDIFGAAALSQSQFFSPNFSFSGALTIEFGDSYYIGLDNIAFDQYRIVTTSGVPEPSTYALFLAGSAALFCLRRRSA